MTWTAGEADAVVLTRLKNASVIHGLHEERVVLALEVARADVPGRAISAATFGLADEEVHARLRIELLPPQARSCLCKLVCQSVYNTFSSHLGRITCLCTRHHIHFALDVVNTSNVGIRQPA